VQIRTEKLVGLPLGFFLSLLAAALQVSVAKLRGQLENLGASDGADAGVIGETSRNSCFRKSETIRDLLLVYSCHPFCVGNGCLD
jgi:hypothetical protein